MPHNPQNLDPLHSNILLLRVAIYLKSLFFSSDNKQMPLTQTDKDLFKSYLSDIDFIFKKRVRDAIESYIYPNNLGKVFEEDFDSITNNSDEIRELIAAAFATDTISYNGFAEIVRLMDVLNKKVTKLEEKLNAILHQLNDGIYEEAEKLEEMYENACSAAEAFNCGIIPPVKPTIIVKCKTNDNSSSTEVIFTHEVKFESHVYDSSGNFVFGKAQQMWKSSVLADAVGGSVETQLSVVDYTPKLLGYK